MEAIMKRTILAIALALSSAVGAHADTSTYVWQGKGPWTDAQLQSAAQVCDQHYGVVENGAITSANYKRCMLKQGWKYGGTARVKTFIDPDSGMSCQDEAVARSASRRRAPCIISTPIRDCCAGEPGPYRSAPIFNRSPSIKFN